MAGVFVFVYFNFRSCGISLSGNAFLTPALSVSSLRSHISPSALYVVDLKKFRKIAAGDRLRGQYQALSQDPNSLSNLDQVHNSGTLLSHDVVSSLFFQDLIYFLIYLICFVIFAGPS